MFVLYVIFNKKHKKTYTGQTRNLETRLVMHNDHRLRGYTSRFDGEWSVLYTESFQTRAEALKREKQLKSFQGRQFVKKLLPE